MTVVNSVNPDRIAGQKTAAFEIVDVLGDAPDVHCIPVGNAGNITAYWQGYEEAATEGGATRRPRMLGWQAAGAAPLVQGEPVRFPETIATAIRIGNPASWDGAIAARDESGGLIDAVTDAEILDAYRLLAAIRGLLRRAGVGGVGRGPAQGGCGRPRSTRRDRRVHTDGARPQGPRPGDPRGRAGTSGGGHSRRGGGRARAVAEVEGQ